MCNEERKQRNLESRKEQNDEDWAKTRICSDEQVVQIVQNRGAIQASESKTVRCGRLDVQHSAAPNEPARV